MAWRYGVRHPCIKEKKEKSVPFHPTLLFSPTYMETNLKKKIKVFTTHVSYNPILNYKNISKLDKSELNYSSLDVPRRNVTP